jgi:hypothetical protein
VDTTIKNDDSTCPVRVGVVGLRHGNIPSKIGQVAAVWALAAWRREADLARGILLAAVCPA